MILSVAFLFCDKTTRFKKSQCSKHIPSAPQGWKAKWLLLLPHPLWQAGCCLRSRFKTNNYSWQHNLYTSKGVSRDTYHHQECWWQWEHLGSPSTSPAEAGNGNSSQTVELCSRWDDQVPTWAGHLRASSPSKRWALQHRWVHAAWVAEAASPRSRPGWAEVNRDFAFLSSVGQILSFRRKTLFKVLHVLERRSALKSSKSGVTLVSNDTIE